MVDAQGRAHESKGAATRRSRLRARAAQILTVGAAVMTLARAAGAQPEPEADVTMPAADPDAAAQPAADPDAAQPAADPDAAQPAPASVTDTIETREPPLLWQEWEIRGKNLSGDTRQTLRAFFAPKMSSQQAITRDSREELSRFAQNIGYYLLDITAEKGAAGTMAVLHLEPVTLVRRVSVDVDNSPIRFYRFDTVFEDEIVRRMRLRAGSPLERTAAGRARQLRVEADRITDYLRHQGYFEAKVDIKIKPDGEHGTRLLVEIQKGPRYEVGDIEVRGNEAVSTADIVAKFRRGQVCVRGWCWFYRFSQQSLNKNIQDVVDLYHKRGYPAVRVTTDFDLDSSFDRSTKTVRFTVIINERRKIDVVFEGSDPERFSDQKLKSLLTFDEEGSYDDVEVVASGEAIPRYYQSRGYFEANVSFQRERFRFFERVVFTIQPGTRLIVREVSFAGNSAVPDRELAGVIKTRPRRASVFFGSGGGYMTSAQIAQDIEQITEFYRQRGFAQATVRARVSRSQKDRDNAAVLAALVASVASSDGLYVTFRIDEGPQNTVESVTFDFQGEHQSTAEDLAQAVGIKAGDAYHPDMLQRGLNQLGRYYFKQGRPHAKVKAETRAGSAPGLVEIIYRVFENHQVRFGKVLVQGNFKTEDWVILDELGYTEGALLTLSRAEAGQQNLRNTGLFSAAQVAFVNLDETREQDINVLVQVEERYDYRLGLEAAGGYSTDAGIFGELGVINPNFLGKGLHVDLRGQYGTQFQSVEGKFIAPRWAVRRYTNKLTGGLLGLSSRFEAAAFWRRETTEPFGNLTSFGTSLAVSKLIRGGLFHDWLVSLRYDLRQRNREEELVRGAGASGDLKKAPVSTRTGAIGPQLVIDKRNDRNGRRNPLTPEAGYKLELRALFADRALLGQDRFVKLGGSAQHFWKPSARLLVSHGVRYDHGIPLDGVLLPDVERYFAGGDTTVRGFEEDRLHTEPISGTLPPLGDVYQLRVRPAGGNVRFIHNLDLQIEVWKLLGIPVASAIFLDTGLVTNSLHRFHPGDLRHALGVALMRWVAPFGSISVEWAIPLDPKLGDDPRGRFHFNFGLLF
jgi:outer membrane protein insertion porin family